MTYKLSFLTATTGIIGSIEIAFCSNSTFVTDPCVAPIGLDVTNAVLGSESGLTGFGISPASSANDIILTRPLAPTAPVTAKMVFDNVTNPTNTGSYYVRVLTYATNDATGPPTDTARLGV